MRKFYDNKLEEEGIKLKIEKSKKLNAERLKMMSKRSELVNEAIKTSEGEIAKFMKDNPDTYKDLLTKLICQSLIKLMEGEVRVLCRESDKDLVAEILEDAEKLYQKTMVENVTWLNGREPPIKLTIDESKWLPEYNPEDK